MPNCRVATITTPTYSYRIFFPPGTTFEQARKRVYSSIPRDDYGHSVVYSPDVRFFFKD